MKQALHAFLGVRVALSTYLDREKLLVISRVQRTLVILAVSMILIVAITFTLRALGSSILWTAINCYGAWVILALSVFAVYLLSTEISCNLTERGFGRARSSHKDSTRIPGA
jgi:hypothetical protein